MNLSKDLEKTKTLSIHHDNNLNQSKVLKELLMESIRKPESESEQQTA